MIWRNISRPVNGGHVLGVWPIRINIAMQCLNLCSDSIQCRGSPSFRSGRLIFCHTFAILNLVGFCEKPEGSSKLNPDILEASRVTTFSACYGSASIPGKRCQFSSVELYGHSKNHTLHFLLWVGLSSDVHCGADVWLK